MTGHLRQQNGETHFALARFPFVFPPLASSSVSVRLLLPRARSFLICNSDLRADRSATERALSYWPVKELAYNKVSRPLASFHPSFSC